MNPRFLLRRLFPLAALVLAAGALAADALAADTWEVVVRDRDRVVELDRSSIIQSDGGTKVAWGRIVLTPDEAAKTGYATIKALNRYDCYNRSFFTIKRVYLDSRQVVLREEAVIDQSPILVARKGVDERLWSEVCRPPTTSELKKVAAHAGKSAEAASPESDSSVAAKPMTAKGEPPAKAPAAKPAPPDTTKAEPPEVARTAKVEAPQRPAALPTPAAASAPLAASAPARRPTPAPVTAAVPTSRARSAASRNAPAAKPSAPAVVDRSVRWSYEGDTGPESWGRMRPEWALCSDGLRQSPIDLRDGVAVDLEPVRFDYRPTRFRITDTGHTLKVDVGEGMGVEIRGRRYELSHVQFHRPSEERVGGRAYDMVAHLHHRDLDGNMAIVAVLLERGDRPHPLVQTLWNNLPLERGTGYMPSVAIDLANLVPANPAHYLYMGSLTTPPCTEGVLWVSMKEPLTVSDEQLRIFARLYPRNSRPIQPHNGRLVLESR